MLTLARIQFAMTTVTHFFFVPTSIGMLLILAILETIYFFTKKQEYKDMVRWWGRIFMSIYIVGVVIGLVLEFQFGMNWSNYSKFVGDVFGVPLAIETMLAFCLEATFVGLWWFGWDKLSRGMHTIAIWLVWLGSILSAVWILTANGFMQRPMGYEIDPATGRAVMTNFGDLLHNEQFWLEFGHVFFATFVIAGFLFATISAWKLLKKKDVDFFMKSLRIGLVFILVGAFCARMVGNTQQTFLANEQPMKNAVAIQAADDKTISKVNEEMIAKYGDLSSEGMSYHLPPILSSFFNFMAWSALFYMGFAIAGLIICQKRWLDQAKPYLFVLGCFVFLPYFTTTFGWLLTEMGRAPWIVYGVFTIADGVSPAVTKPELITSIGVFGFTYLSLIALAVFLVFRDAKVDPYSPENQRPNPYDSQMSDPFGEGIY